jgi:hypothetical protein
MELFLPSKIMTQFSSWESTWASRACVQNQSPSKIWERCAPCSFCIVQPKPEFELQMCCNSGYGIFKLSFDLFGLWLLHYTPPFASTKNRRSIGACLLSLPIKRKHRRETVHVAKSIQVRKARRRFHEQLFLTLQKRTTWFPMSTVVPSVEPKIYSHRTHVARSTKSRELSWTIW